MREPVRGAPDARPIRIAHVVDVLALAGMEYGVIKLVNRLDRERFQPVIFCLRHRNEEVKELLASRIPVLEFRKPPAATGA